MVIGRKTEALIFEKLTSEPSAQLSPWMHQWSYLSPPKRGDCSM